MIFPLAKSVICLYIRFIKLIKLTIFVNTILREKPLKILFRSPKDAKLFNTHRLLVRRYGACLAEKIRTRLDDLQAAIILEDMRYIGRCHELRGNRAGQLSLYLVHPQRLVFKPADQPIPIRPDGGLDWKRVTSVLILGVEDYHE